MILFGDDGGGGGAGIMVTPILFVIVSMMYWSSFPQLWYSSLVRDMKLGSVG